MAMQNKRLFKIILLIIISFASIYSYSTKKERIPRTIIGLYNSSDYKSPRNTMVHNLTEMPLNYLGLKVQYQDIKNPLPKLSNNKSIRGITSWFEAGSKVDNPKKYINWLKKIIDNKKKALIIGSPGFYINEGKIYLPKRLINNFWNLFNLSYNGNWVDFPYDFKIKTQKPMALGFERKYPIEKKSFRKLIPKGLKRKPFLYAINKNNPQKRYVLGLTNSSGGYIASKYAHNIQSSPPALYQWYINPFIFFKNALNTKNLPKPDVTTLAGKRIFYSHIDGDGWNNTTQIQGYKKKHKSSAEVIYKEILKKYPNLPVTVAPIVAEIAPELQGTQKSKKTAKKIFSLPNVEAASHTYTHPLDWQFFKNYSKKSKKQSKSKKLTEKIKSFFHTNQKKVTGEGGYHSDKSYSKPRSYTSVPFDLDNEINGSVKYINKLLPKGKKVSVLQWPGNCQPFEQALSKVKEAGLKNINGGDSRFDNQYPSYSWVSPIGIKIGNEIQIYAGSSNENTYTHLWKADFFSFKYLQRSLYNTEVPKRVKPIDLYYHMYSGSKHASLKALKENIKYILKQDIIPIKTSTYCNIAEGFFSCKIFSLGENKWQIEERKGLQTIRFDKALLKTVDFQNSKGVIGQKHFHGSLYVHLDSSIKEPIIKLNKTNIYWKEPVRSLPYLIDSSWQVKNLKNNKNHFSFQTKGFGSGKMRWKVPKNGKYKIKYLDKTGKTTVKDKVLNLHFESRPNSDIKVTVKYLKQR